MQTDLEHLSFAEWLIQLNKCAIETGYKSDQPFVQITGQLCWHPFYEIGLTPSSALEEAVRDGMAYGSEYDFDACNQNKKP